MSYNSHDLRADELQALADDMSCYREAFDIAQCESRNHNEHRGELWQCGECLRVFCGEEGADDADSELCNDCWARLHSPRHAVCLA